MSIGGGGRKKKREKIRRKRDVKGEKIPAPLPLLLLLLHSYLFIYFLSSSNGYFSKPLISKINKIKIKVNSPNWNIEKVILRNDS